MTSHYTAKELAGLPGMQKTESAVIRLAKREAWPHQKRAGRGGGKEYPLDVLPIATKRHLNKLAEVIYLPTVKAEAPVPAEIVLIRSISELTGHQHQVMNARVWLMKALESDMALGHILEESLKYVVDQIDMKVQPFVGQAALANDRIRKNGNKLISKRTLVRYWSAWQASGRKPTTLAPNDRDVQRIQNENDLVAFARDFGTLKDTGMLPATVPAWVPYFLTAYRQPQKPSLTDAIRSMSRTMPSQIEMPTYGQVRHLFNKIPAVYIEKGRRTGAELKSIMGFNRRVWNEFDPFTCGQIDGHSFKAYVAHPVSGAHFHPEVCGIVDMTTKICTGFSAGLAESWRTVSDAFRHSCTVNDKKPVGGVYRYIEADLGAGNKSKVNSDAEIGLFAMIGTELLFPEVAGNPQGHGGIERSNQSIWIRGAKMLPTYTGKDMDRSVRKKIYTKLEQDLKCVKKAGELGKVEKTSKLVLSWRQFLEALEIWVNEYNNTPHSALPKITDENGRRRHRTPLEELAHRIAEGWDPKSVQLKEDMLDHLFMPQERINIYRREFTLHGNRYHAYELETHHEEEMIAAFDIHDANHVWVTTLDGRLICQATWNGNRIYGIPKSKVDQESDKRIDGQLKRKQRDIDMIEASKRKAVVVEHPEAMQIKRLSAPEVVVTSSVEPTRKIIQLAQPVAPEFPEGRRERWMYWNQLHERLVEMDELSDKEMQFYSSFRNSPTWKSFNMLQQAANKEPLPEATGRGLNLGGLHSHAK